MTTSDNGESPDEMRSEYDFSGGIRGKYLTRFADGAALPTTKARAEDAKPEGSTEDPADAG